MAVMTVRLPDDKHERLKALANHRGVSLNKLMEEFATIAITEFDTESRFLARQQSGNPQRGLELLDILDGADLSKPS